VECIQYDKITFKMSWLFLCKDLRIIVRHSENCEFFGDLNYSV